MLTFYIFVATVLRQINGLSLDPPLRRYRHVAHDGIYEKIMRKQDVAEVATEVVAEVAANLHAENWQQSAEEAAMFEVTADGSSISIRQEGGSRSGSVQEFDDETEVKGKRRTGRGERRTGWEGKKQILGSPITGQNKSS